MDLLQLLATVRKRWVVIVACVLLGLLLAAAASLATTPRYAARSSIFFSVSAGSVGELAQASTYAEKQVQSFAEVARSPLVLQPVIEELGLSQTTQQLSEQVVVTVPQETVIISIQVLDTDAETAALIANAISAELEDAVGAVTRASGSEDQQVQATTIAPATVPTRPTSPNVPRNVALGLLVGLFVGLGVAVLRDVLDTRVRSEVDVAKVTDTSVIGVISMDPDAAPHPLVIQADPHSPRSEAYRTLRTNLQFLDLADRPSTIVMTSSIPGEGKSTTCINLATTLAEAGQSVLLVDADLRRPQVAKYLQLEGRVGLTTVLIGRADLTDVVQPFGNGNLHVLPSGQIPPNPSELLGSARMKDLLAEATARYDVVLIDSPPLLPVTDSAVLSRIAGGAVLVVGSTSVHRSQLQGSLEALARVDAHILGLVLNKVQRRNADRYSYDYAHREGYAPTPQEQEAAVEPRSGPRPPRSGRGRRGVNEDDPGLGIFSEEQQQDRVR